MLSKGEIVVTFVILCFFTVDLLTGIISVEHLVRYIVFDIGIIIKASALSKDR
jgi:hypothetical protein